jgi:hypothetical protein
MSNYSLNRKQICTLDWNHHVTKMLQIYCYRESKPKISKGAWNSLENIQVPITRFLAKIAITCNFFELVFILLVNFCKKLT